MVQSAFAVCSTGMLAVSSILAVSRTYDNNDISPEFQTSVRCRDPSFRRRYTRRSGDMLPTSPLSPGQGLHTISSQQ